MKLKTLFCALLALITITVSAQTFTNTAPMNFARYWHSGVLLANGKVLVAGGFDYLQRYLASAELYDPATGQWTNTGSMNVPRNNFTAVLLRDGKVLVAGGYNSTSNYLSSAELYDPSTGTWTETGSLHAARNWHAAVLLTNGKVLVAGGADSYNNSLASVEIYDPATGIWTSTGDLNVSRENHSATLLANGNVLVAGGSSPSGGYLSSSEIYNPDTGNWTITDSLKLPTAYPTATLLQNGQVLVTGGIYQGAVLSDVELFDPVSATWTKTKPMNEPRTWHSSTLLPNGKVLVAGTWMLNNYSDSSAELYDPLTGAWTTVGSMKAARSRQVAILLPNWQVLMAAGVDGPNILASSELFVNSPLSSPSYVVAWGDNSSGETSVPDGLHDVIAIAAGGFHSMALKSDHTIVAWGDNGFRELQVPPGIGPVAAIAAGYDSSIALNSAGQVFAWGYNRYGQTSPPTAALTNVIAIAANNFQTLALLNDGRVVAWGDNIEGECTVPANVHDIVAISEGYSHSLALKNDGTVFAWGLNTSAQCDVPSNLNHVISISGGYFHNLALKDDGTVVGWGDNTYGQITIPSGLKNVIAIAAGGYHSLALKNDGTVIAWGQNDAGQCTLPAGLSNVVAIAADNIHSLALVAPQKSPITLPASGVTTSAAQLNGSVLPGTGTTAYFQYGQTAAYGKTSPKATLGSAQQTLAFSLTDLLPATTYHYQIVVSGPAGTVSGGGVQFSTLPVSTSATSARVAGTFGLGLRLHSAPSLSSPVLLVMPEGAVVTLLGGTQSADGHLWRNIGYGTQTGWAAAEYLIFGSPQSPPSPPNALAQRQSDGTTPFPPAGTAPSATVVLAAKPVGLANQQFQIQFELRPTGTTFSAPTATSASGPGGTPAQITVPNLPNHGYHWRARSLDGYGQVSDWVSFSTDPTDFTVAAPAVPRAFFSVSPQVIFPGDSVQFTATASTQPGLTFAWDFGNGQTATGPSTTQTFPQVGTLVARLTITDPHGHTSTSTQIINIQSHDLVNAINTLAQDTEHLFDSLYAQAADCASAADYFRPGVNSAQAKIALESVFDGLSFGLSALDLKQLLGLTVPQDTLLNAVLNTVADYSQTAAADTLDSLYQRHQSPSDILLPPIQNYIQQKKLELETLRLKAIAATAAIPAGTADAMAKNLLARYVGNLAISDNYQAKATLPVTYAALKQADEDSWSYILASHLFTFSVGLGLDALGAGPFGAAADLLPYAATTGLSTLNIVGLLSEQSTDAQMLGLSMGVLSQTVSGARLMVNNAEQGLQSVIAAQASQTPNSVMTVEHFAEGTLSGVGFTPSWLTDTAYDIVTIYNSGTVAADFRVEARYAKTFSTVGLIPFRTYGIGDHEYPLTVVSDGNLVHLDHGQQGTIQITYKTPAGGEIPSTDITYALTANTADGLYGEPSQSSHFGTTHLDANGQVVDPATLPQGLLDTTAPLHATVVQYGDSTIATLNIYLGNPFDTPLLINLQQPLQPGTTVLDAAGGTVSNTQITWEVDLLPGDLRFLPVSLQLPASPTQSPLGATAASAYDSQNANWLQFSAAPNLLTITNLPAAGLKSLGFQTDGFHLQLEPLVPGVYQFQSSTNLSTWTGLTTLTNLQNAVELKDPAALTNAVQFYRAIKTQ